jgi:hypothetical protein
MADNKNDNGSGGENPNDKNLNNSNTNKDNSNSGEGGDGGEKNVPLSRFNEVNEKLKALEAAEEKRKSEAKKAEEEALTKNKEFETLATKREEEIKQVRAELVETKVQNAVERAAAKLGAVDPEAVYKLLDRSNVKVTDDGKIEGVEDAVKSLLEARPYLKGDGKSSPSTIGAGSNPDNSETKKYPLSWVRARWADVAWTRAKHDDLGGLTGAEFLKKIEDEARIDPNS